ncbi:ABC transporter ATP-binding protein [uncultured Roseobacter sp.]|uniref:ABC transporter ATP-binding protein n=1 Tax=uncultured Roseobacter sp. TaxID=114847 RepID=UPI002634C3CF|nr:ABC transporter ATP-binding protein [uncultured Roseobacter sp.]
MTKSTGLNVGIEGLRIDFDDFTALKPTDLQIREKELFTLLGPSGCGKTTLLRCLAGFIKPTAGRVLFDGRDVSVIDPWDRGIGFVFQNYALWPTKTIARNVAYGLEMRGLSKSVIREKVAETLKLVELTGAADQYPGELSGGMQQRAALARAIIIDPPLLLFDEPLSNLDAKLRVKLRRDIRDLQTRLGLTAIYVTHDQEEALDISDRIAVMRQGEVMQVGTPREIYETPANAHVADFVGKACFIAGRVVSDGQFQLTSGTTFPATMTPETTTEAAVAAFARPEHISFTAPGAGDLAGVVTEVSYLGNLTRYLVSVEGQPIMVETRDAVGTGQQVGLKLPPLRLFNTMPTGHISQEAA